MALKKYLIQKGYEERADARNLHAKIRNLKWRQMLRTLEGLNKLVTEMQTDTTESDISDEVMDYCYEQLAQIWS